MTDQEKDKTVADYIQRTEEEQRIGRASAELPQYQCHKKVWALKIKEVIDPGRHGSEAHGRLLLAFENDKYAPKLVDQLYAAKHRPKAGGYYVQYDDGYESFSPAEAFEGGYSLITRGQPTRPVPAPVYSPEDIPKEIPPHQQRVLDEKAALDEKIDKLTEFLADPPVKLPAAESKRLAVQLGFMCGYSTVLAERIAAF